MELLRHSVLLVGQNTDDNISALSIQIQIAQLYAELDQRNQAINLLKAHNPMRINHAQIGNLLAISNQLDEAIPYLSDALIDSVLHQIQIADGYLNVYVRQKKYPAAIEMLNWILDGIRNLQYPNQTCFLNRTEVVYLALLAEMQLYTGLKKEAGKTLRQAKQIALRFDAEPNYALNRLRFVMPDEHTSAYDSMGETAMASDYISAFSNDAATIERDYLEKRFSLLTNAAKLIGSLVMMLVYSPVMTAVACAFFILPVGASLLAGNRMKEAERNVSDKNGRFIAALKDSLSGFSVVKSFRAEDSILELLGQSSLDSEQAKCEKRKLSTVIGALGGVAGVTAQLGTFLAGAYLARAGWGITPGVLLIFIDLTANVIGPLRDMPELLAARKAAIALIDKLAEALESNVRDDGVKIPDRLETGIEVSDHFAKTQFFNMHQ